MMPPSGARRPDRALLDAFAADLEGRIDRAALPNANLTTPALHRLNRIEYANAIRDLLDLQVDVTPLLPGDGSVDGFDNVAEALSVSPSLVQGYVSAAMKISRLAVGDRSLVPQQLTFPAPPGLAQDAHIEGLPLGTRGGMLVHYTFPLDAEYEFTINGGGGGGFFGGGAGPAAAIDFTIDGTKIPVTNPRKFRVPVSAGPHSIGLAMVDRARGAGVDEIFSDFRENSVFKPQGGIQGLVITGPFNASGVGDTPSRRRIFVCRPTVTSGDAHPAPAVKRVAASSQTSATAPRRRASSPASGETGCARQILSTVARRAYRGPVTSAEIDTLMQFYEQGKKAGDFETGIQQALARVLVAPRFVFRVEDEPKSVAPGGVYRISDVDLASRLSFFLWSSIPDDELLDLALKGRLHDPAVLEKQVRRMITDPKGDALIRNFAGQWLYLRELANVQTEATIQRQPPRGVPHRDRDVVGVDRARGSTATGVARRGLHLRRRASREALRNFERARVVLPQDRAARRQSATRHLRSGQHADDHVDCNPHLTGAARQVRSRHAPGRAATSAAAGRGNEPGKGPGASEGDDAAPASRTASRQPGVCAVPQLDGSDRVLARELRSDRRVARVRRTGEG